MIKRTMIISILFIVSIFGSEKKDNKSSSGFRIEKLNEFICPFGIGAPARIRDPYLVNNNNFLVNNDKVVFIGEDKKSVIFWDMSKQSPRKLYTEDSCDINAFKINSDCSKLVIGRKQGFLEIWDISSVDTPQMYFKANSKNKEDIGLVEISNNNRVFASFRNLIIDFDISNEKIIKKIKDLVEIDDLIVSMGGINNLIVNKDDTWILVCLPDEIHIYGISNSNHGQILSRMNPPDGGMIWNIRHSALNHHRLFFLGNNEIELYDLKDIYNPKLISNNVQGSYNWYLNIRTAISDNNKFMLTESNIYGVKLWKIVNPNNIREIAALPISDSVESLSFESEEEKIASNLNWFLSEVLINIVMKYLGVAVRFLIVTRNRQRDDYKATLYKINETARAD